MGEHGQRAAVVLDGVVDALGVIVGPTRLHLPAEHGAAFSSRCGGAEPQAQSLCGLTAGWIVARDGVDSDLPMCVICMNVAANLILTAEEIRGRVRARRPVLR